MTKKWFDLGDDGPLHMDETGRQLVHFIVPGVVVFEKRYTRHETVVIVATALGLFPGLLEESDCFEDKDNAYLLPSLDQLNSELHTATQRLFDISAVYHAEAKSGSNAVRELLSKPLGEANETVSNCTRMVKMREEADAMIEQLQNPTIENIADNE